MRVLSVKKLNEKHIQYDITTLFENFFIKTKNSYVLIHNSPSLVFGHAPGSGKFFVASKSAFNKNPKINYSVEDIEKNHKHAPGLVKKLKAAFDHLPSVVPKEGVYQGDIMYTPEDVNHHGNSISFRPNTITYSTSKDTPEGRRIADTKLGLVVHTKYKGDDLSKMKATFKVDQSKFKNNGEVHFIDPKVQKNSIKYTPNDEKEFAHNMLRARQLHSLIAKNKGYDAIKSQEDLILGYVNSTVKNKTQPSAHGYMAFIKRRHENVMKDLKTDKSKEKKQIQIDDLMSSVAQNKVAFGMAFDLQQTLQKAKQPLVKALSTSSPFKQTINDKPTGPEGFVATQNGIPVKLVDRHEFSAANFEWNARANPEDNPMVFSFGRMNPVTIGHAQLVNRVMDVARRMGAQHKIVLSHSQDSEKNPLTPDQKLKYAKEAFPAANITVAGKDDATVIQQLKKLNQSGVRHLTMVVGDDRVKDFEKLINQYNGKEYLFKKVNVVSAGKRDDKAEGVEGMSASKMRAAAMSNDFESFRKGAPKDLKPADVRSMFNDLRNNMKKEVRKVPKPDKEGKVMMGVTPRSMASPIRIDDKTPGITLGRYASRSSSDPTAQLAKKEIQRRIKAKAWHGSTKGFNK